MNNEPLLDENDFVYPEKGDVLQLPNSQVPSYANLEKSRIPSQKSRIVSSRGLYVKAKPTNSIQNLSVAFSMVEEKLQKDAEDRIKMRRKSDCSLYSGGVCKKESRFSYVNPEAIPVEIKKKIIDLPSR